MINKYVNVQALPYTAYTTLQCNTVMMLHKLYDNIIVVSIWLLLLCNLLHAALEIQL